MEENAEKKAGIEKVPANHNLCQLVLLLFQQKVFEEFSLQGIPGDDW